MPNLSLFAAIAALCALTACGSDVATGRRCPNGERACDGFMQGGGSGARGGAAGASGSAGSNPIGSGDNALTLHVEDIEGMTIEIITLACAGDCADVEAVAHGGNPPYRLEWEDGSTHATRSVCLDASTTLRVSATDTAIDTEEFEYEAHTVDTEVTANVLDCSTDAGVPPDDAATDLDCRPLAIATTAVVACESPAEGGLNPIEDFSLRADEATGFHVTGNGQFFGEGWHYEVWGSSDGCALDELLATFQLANGPIDINVCLEPERSHAHVVLFYRFAPTDGLSLSTWELERCTSCAAR